MTRRIGGVALGVLLSLGGCSSVSQISATIAGGVAGTATGNPAIGFAVGVATDAAASYVTRYYGRVRQGAEQDAIAQVAGGLPVGQEVSWKIDHTIPIGDEHGQLRVVEVEDTALALCKRIVFSVDENKRRAWYSADICKDAKAWKWATAEPAVARWGFLQ